MISTKNTKHKKKENHQTHHTLVHLNKEELFYTSPESRFLYFIS